MKKEIILGSMAIVLGSFIFFAQNTFAYRGSPNVKDPNYSPERHEAMLKAFANKDYNAWKNLIGDQPITKRINASNFAKFVQAHQLTLQGKIDEANKIRAELGLGQGIGYGRGGQFRNSYNK